MRLFHFSSGATIALNVIMWFLIHLSAGYVGAKQPASLFMEDSGIFRPRPWEKEGAIYLNFFRVKKWKRKLPDCGNAFGQNASKKKLSSQRIIDLEALALETRRAEWTHWLQIFPAPVFFLFNSWSVGLFMIFYALAVNTPCIFAQRFNRPRLIKIIEKKKSRLGTAPGPTSKLYP